MDKKKLSRVLFFGGLIFLAWASIAQAGFGVAPSEVWSDRLIPGSHFEQAIYLVRSKPDVSLKVEVEVEAEEVKDWISFEHGETFEIPAGHQQFPLKVIVDVPKDAEFKNYRGKIWIKTSPLEQEEGMVGIALGAVVDINLTLSTEEIYGFAFRGVTIKDAEESRSIKVAVKLENIGNVKDKPSRIVLNIYDAYLTSIIKSYEITELEDVKPFETKSLAVRFPNKLPMGTYFGEIQVFKEGQIIGDAKQAFKVVERTGILYKIFSNWYGWVGLILIILTTIVVKKKDELSKAITRWKNNKTKKKRKRLKEKLKNL